MTPACIAAAVTAGLLTIVTGGGLWLVLIVHRADRRRGGPR